MTKRLVFLLSFLFLLPTTVLASDASPTPTPSIINNVNQSGGGIDISNNNNNQNSNTNNNNISINTTPVKFTAVPKSLPATGSDPSPLALGLLFGAIPAGLTLRRYKLRKN